MSTPSNPAVAPPESSLPLQFSALNAEHFKTPGGVAAVNLLLQQMVNAINAGNGAAGRVSLPHGIDVRGATISGVGAPKSETDAISAGHAQDQYSAKTQQPKFDLGGSNQLKGLGYVYQQTKKNAAAIASIPSTYTGGGVLSLFGALLQFGLIANMDTAVFPMNFPEPFPTACQALVAFTTGPNDRITYASVLPTTTQFTLANNGAGAGAFWIALGY